MNRELYYYDENEIRELLLYRKIVKADNDTLYLDNGVELEVIGNEGCGGCSGGWYEVTEINDCNNAITDVEFVEDCETKDEYDSTSYKIFVLTADDRIKILQVDGDDGSGYYGTGYRTIVRMKGVKDDD